MSFSKGGGGNNVQSPFRAEDDSLFVQIWTLSFSLSLFLALSLPHRNEDWFVCLVSKSRFFFIWIRHHYRWLAAHFDLHIYARHSWSLSDEQWGFFSVPHLLRHGAFDYNGHLRGPMTLTPIAERLAVELWLLFNDLGF